MRTKKILLIKKIFLQKLIERQGMEVLKKRFINFKKKGNNLCLKNYF